MDSKEKIRIGVVGRAHGVHGAIRIFTDDENSDSLLRTKSIYLGQEKTPYRVLKATRCGRFFALELEGIDDRDKAFELTGQEVFIERGHLRPLRNAYYACDLVGLTIRDADGTEWGTVISVLPGTAHELLQYERKAGGKGLIPFVSAYIGDVDLEQHSMTVDTEWIRELDSVYGD